jgi:hypothetical protein
MSAYNAWTQWLRHADPLSHKLYHVGNVAMDRRYDPELDKIASLLMALSDLGFVILYQRRIEHEMNYFVVPCFRPLIEKVDAEGVKVKRLVDGEPVQVMVYGDLQCFRGSRGFEHGCIAEAEALVGLPVSDGLLKRRRK